MTLLAAQQYDEDEESFEVEEVAEAPVVKNDFGRYPGDILKDKKTNRKGRYVNDYGTNGKAVIVIPDGMSRAELWDASTIEIIKKVKRPEQNFSGFFNEGDAAATVIDAGESIEDGIDDLVDDEDDLDS